MIKALLGHRLDAWIEAAFPFLIRRPLNPHLLTVCGVAISLGSAYAFAAGHFRTGGILFLLGGSFDLIDGVVARRHKLSTTFGAFLDSTSDRFVDMVVLLGIAIHFAKSGQPSLVLLTGAGLIASVLVSYAKARAERYVPHFEGGVLERGERVVVLALGAFFGFAVLALWIIVIGGGVTIFQRFVQAYREMERLDATQRSTASGEEA